VLLGLFATTAFNPHGANGLLSGDPSFFVKELAAVVLSSIWAFGFTFGMLWLIDRLTPVHVAPGQEELGLDQALHHEDAYLGAI
jgi:ammonium transporter, Amt family